MTGRRADVHWVPGWLESVHVGAERACRWMELGHPAQQAWGQGLVPLSALPDFAQLASAG